MNAGGQKGGELNPLLEGILSQFSAQKEAAQFLESIGIIGLHAVLASQNSARWKTAKQNGSFGQRFLDAARTLASEAFNLFDNLKLFKFPEEYPYADVHKIVNPLEDIPQQDLQQYPSELLIQNRKGLENEIEQLNRQLDQLNHQIDAQKRKTQLTSSQHRNYDIQEQTSKEHQSFTGLPPRYVPQQSRNKRFQSPSSKKDITQKITSSPPPDLSQVIYEKRMASRQQKKREQLEGNQMQKALQISGEIKSPQKIPKLIQQSPSPRRNMDAMHSKNNIPKRSAKDTGVNRSPNHSNRDLLIVQQQQLFSSDAFPQYKSATDQQRQIFNMNHNNNINNESSAQNQYLSPSQRNYQSPPPPSNPLQSPRKMKRLSHPPSNSQYPHHQGYPSIDQGTRSYQQQHAYEYNSVQQQPHNMYGQQQQQYKQFQQQSQYGSSYPEEYYQSKFQQPKQDGLGLIPYINESTSDQDPHFRSKEQYASLKQRGQQNQNQPKISSKIDTGSALTANFNEQASIPVINKPPNYMGSMYGIPFDAEAAYPYGSTESYPNELVKYMSVESNQNPSLGGDNMPLTSESQFLMNQQQTLQQQQRLLGNPNGESQLNDYYFQQQQQYDPSITKGHPQQQGSQQFNSQQLQPWITAATITTTAPISNPGANNNLFESEVLQHSQEGGGNKFEKGAAMMTNPFYRNYQQSPPQQQRGATTQFSQNFQQAGINDIANSFLSSPLVRHLNSLQNPFPGSPNVTQLKYSYLKPDIMQDSRAQQFTQANFCQSVSPQKQSFSSADNKSILSAGVNNNILVSHNNDQVLPSSPAKLSSSWIQPIVSQQQTQIVPQQQQLQQQQHQQQKGQHQTPNQQQYLNASKKNEFVKNPANQNLSSSGQDGDIQFVSSPTFLDTQFFNTGCTNYEFATTERTCFAFCIINQFIYFFICYHHNNIENHYYHQQHELKALPQQSSSSFSQNRTADFISTREQEGRERPNSFGIQQSKVREKLMNDEGAQGGEQYEDKRRNQLNQAARGVEQRKQQIKGEKGVIEQYSRKQQQHQKNETRISPQEIQVVEQFQKEKEEDLDQEEEEVEVEEEEEGQEANEVDINQEDTYELRQVSREQQDVDEDIQNEQLREDDHASENQKEQGYFRGQNDEINGKQYPNEDDENNLQFKQEYEENSFQEQENRSDRNNNSHHNNYSNDMKQEFLSSKASFGERRDKK